MLIGVIADDFTGASDIANTLAKGVAPEGGLATAQFSGIPNGPAPEGIDAGVVALKSRSAPPGDAVADSLAALDWLKAQGCRQFVFKYCSTFDSTPEGNIGPVAEALANALGVRAAVVCPAFPTAGRTVFQGHLFVFGRLLSESGMQHHPLTPMTDPDIRRWLARQCRGAVGHVAEADLRAGQAAVRRALDRAAGEGALLCVVDATSDDDLLTIGEALDGAPLVTGGSGIARGLPRNFIRNGEVLRRRMDFDPVSGPAALIAGSCSGATLAQVEEHGKTHPSLAIDVAAVMTGDVIPGTLVDFFVDHVEGAPLAFSSGGPDDVRAMQDRFGRESVSAKLDALFADTARLLLERGFRRFVIAGGETSGAVAQAVAETLGADAMRVGPEIDPGVPALRIGETAPVAMVLKSGNFGGPNFFEKALAVMEGKG